MTITKNLTEEQIKEIQQVAVETYRRVLNEEIEMFPPKFWTDEYFEIKAAACIRYLVEEVLGEDKYSIRSKFKYSLFREYKLLGMMKHFGDGGVLKAYLSAFPTNEEPWEIGIVPVHYWDDISNRKRAVDWLVNKLEFNEVQVAYNLTKELFLANSLSSLIYHKDYNSSPKRIIEHLYPDIMDKIRSTVFVTDEMENKDANCIKMNILIGNIFKDGKFHLEGRLDIGLSQKGTRYIVKLFDSVPRVYYVDGETIHNATKKDLMTFYISENKIIESIDHNFKTIDNSNLWLYETLIGYIGCKIEDLEYIIEGMKR